MKRKEYTFEEMLEMPIAAIAYIAQVPDKRYYKNEVLMAQAIVALGED